MEDKLPLSFSFHRLLLLFLIAGAPSVSFGKCDGLQGDGYHPPSARRRKPASEKLIFVLAGQSNMAGRGGVSDDRWIGLIPPECSPSPRILRLSARLQWEVAREPLHADIDVNKTCGVGPGMPFAHALLSSSPAVVKLVPCAIGGTRIEEWEKGATLYDSLVRRTLAAAGGGARVAAVLWYQGESDTVSREDAEAYKGRMERLIHDLRSDLGLPNLLVIQVALASGEGKYTKIVRRAQRSIKLPNVACVDAMGMKLGKDHLHLTTQAQVQLGQMLAAAYLNHAPKP